MEQQSLFIDKIPSVLWGPVSDKLMIAVHGNQSHKRDTVIGILAEVAVENGYQVLSFDLPEHGDRKEEHRLCDAENSVEDLKGIFQYAQGRSDYLSVFGCSIGAYFSMLAYQAKPIQKALFLSPVVDMKQLIENMMLWFNVSIAQLEKEKTVVTPIITLYWHYYQYVLQHPVEWDKPTALLYGSKDNLCPYETVKSFAESCHANMCVLEGGEHFFHTKDQLAFFRAWLHQNING